MIYAKSEILNLIDVKEASSKVTGKTNAKNNSLGFCSTSAPEDQLSTYKTQEMIKTDEKLKGFHQSLAQFF